MTTWDDIQPLIERYRAVFNDEPADFINLWNLDAFEAAMLKAIDSGRPMPDAPPSENNIPVET